MTTQETIKPASIGSISHGTLKTEDLLDSFASELDWQIRRNGQYFSQPENFALRDKLNNLVGAANDCFGDPDDEIEEDKWEMAEEMVNEYLPNALSEHFTPPYCYFGTHEGDGSDFGYWPDMSQIDELPTVADSDAAKELGDDCKSVNDHGNVTVYGGDGSIILELV